MTDAGTLDEKDARIHELEEQLRPKHEDYMLPLRLTQQQAMLLAVLMEMPVASAKLIHERVGMETEAKVAVHRLRKALKSFGIEVSAKRFFGFWLEDTEKAKIKEIIGG